MTARTTPGRTRTPRPESPDRESADWSTRAHRRLPRRPPGTTPANRAAPPPPASRPRPPAARRTASGIGRAERYRPRPTSAATNHQAHFPRAPSARRRIPSPTFRENRRHPHDRTNHPGPLHRLELLATGKRTQHRGEQGISARITAPREAVVYRNDVLNRKGKSAYISTPSKAIFGSSSRQPQRPRPNELHQRRQTRPTQRIPQKRRFNGAISSTISPGRNHGRPQQARPHKRRQIPFHRRTELHTRKCVTPPPSSRPLLPSSRPQGSDVSRAMEAPHAPVRAKEYERIRLGQDRRR